MVTFWWSIKLKSHTLQHQNRLLIVLFVCFSHAIGMLLERNSMHIASQLIKENEVKSKLV